MSGDVRIREARTEWGTLIVFDAPSVRNAINRATTQALLDIVGEKLPGAIVLAAEGPVFSAGGDLFELRDLLEGGRIAQTLHESMGLFHELIGALASFPGPTVAAVHGVAAGGAMSLALACDVRVATRTAAFVPAFLRAGATPDGAAALLLARAVGPAKAKAALLANLRLDASSPLAGLLFDEIVERDEELLPRAIAVAQMLAGLNPHALRLTKGLFEDLMGSLKEALEAERRASLDNVSTPEFANRLRRQLESLRD
jgi:enoyl-CoA hydratase/carnithine racemase